MFGSEHVCQIDSDARLVLGFVTSCLRRAVNPETEVEWLSGSRKSKDAAKVASFYSTDALLLDQGRSVLKGRAAIEQSMAKGLQGSLSQIVTTVLDTSSAGDIGYVVGTFTQPTSTGGAATREDHFDLEASQRRVDDRPRHVQLGRNSIGYQQVDRSQTLKTLTSAEPSCSLSTASDAGGLGHDAHF